MVAPAIESGVIPETGMVAVVHVAVPVVAAIDAGVVVAAAEVGTGIVSVTAKIAVGTLHISAMPADVHDARSVVHTDHRAPAVQTIANVHAAAVDRSNLSIGADARRTTTSQRNVPGSCWRMSGSARAPAVRLASTLGSAATLSCMAAFRRVSALRTVPALGCMAAFRRVSALRTVPALGS